MADEKITLLQKLQRIHKQANYIQKSDSSSQYNYAGSSAVVGLLHGLMDDEGIILKPEITGHSVQSTTNQKGRTTYFTELDMRMTWINTDDKADTMECDWYAQGVNIAGEKGVGKALTYGEKYFLLKFFNIATDDMDPDAFDQNVQAAKKPDPVTKQQIQNLQTLFKSIGKLANMDETAIEASFLAKVQINNRPVDSLNQLNHNIAGQLITQANKKLKKMGKENQNNQQSSSTENKQPVGATQ